MFILSYLDLIYGASNKRIISNDNDPKFIR